MGILVFIGIIVVILVVFCVHSPEKLYICVTKRRTTGGFAYGRRTMVRTARNAQLHGLHGLLGRLEQGLQREEPLFDACVGRVDDFLAHEALDTRLGRRFWPR